MKLNTPIEDVKGVGPQLAMHLAGLGLYTIEDVLMYFPRKYDDYSQLVTVNKLRPGQVSVRAYIKQARGRHIRGGLHITEAVASDESGSVRLVWFNQPYRERGIKAEQQYLISGNFELKSGRLAILNPSIEPESSFPVNTARIIPIYKETKDINSRLIRKIVKSIFDSKVEIPETLPAYVIKKEGLLSRRDAFFYKHFPSNPEDIQASDERLGYEELFEIILASQVAKQQIGQLLSQKVPFKKALAQKFVKNLPYDLTNAQRKSIWRIYQDMDSDRPMNRLLEGDVGAGKTVVATMAALMAIAEDFQVAFMAPTELLARQHAETIYSMLKPLGYDSQTLLLVGSMKSVQKQRAHKQIENGEAKMIIGTHALIQEKIAMPKLALAIVDEQHRFGVDQRKRLLAKTTLAPHMLSMTATPIPRSLALTVFGELDVSILGEKPKSRLPIKTELIPMTDRDRLYKRLEDQLKLGEQMFVVCPLIEDSQKLAVRSVESTHKELAGRFKTYNVGLLHGKMKSEDKQAIMQDFVSGKTNVLVSTTVIEVGVDVPNASIMMIEAPERFGLAQLHQLRGRIGRGNKQGHCYLMLSDAGNPSRRLRAIENTQDGFKLAELDLELRGAGALYGTLQHGALDLRIAKFTDTKLVARAREAAIEFMEDPQKLIQYPHIKKRITELQAVVHLN